MKNIFLKQMLMLSFMLAIVATTHALDVETHKAINDYIAHNSLNGFSLGTYLSEQLGLQGGIEEKFNSVEAWKWLRDGGRYEDVPPWTIIPYLRSVNHFHNPLKAWNEAGLNDIFTGTSSVIWAQDQSSSGLFLGGDWSWKKAREYFYIALTGKDFSGNLVAADKTQRDAYFAKTFRACGQIMHLVEDASVPAHVRNNSHIFGEGYEEWVEDTRKNNQNIFNNLMASSLSFDSSILNETPNPLAPIPIAKIFDTDKYAEGITPSTSLSWGIAEYTNANFASQDTIFTENFDHNHKYYFPYPKYSAQSYEMYDIDIPPDKKRIYLRKIGDGEPIEHFATAGPLYKYLNFDPVLQRDELKLDPAVHADYAALLIPRAVGYSAGLLNYFFRGQIDMVHDDATGSGYVIVNNTDEDMNGTFELWYDNTSEQRLKAWNNSLTIGKQSSGNNKSANFTFTPPSGAKEPGKYMLVFRGQLGNEADAVVGKLLDFSWYGYYDGSTSDNRYFWSSKTKTWNLVPLTDLSYNEIGKRLAIGKNGTVVVAEQGGSNGSQIKIAASLDYGVTWLAMTMMPAEGDNLPAIDASEDGVFWLGVGSHRGVYNQSDQFVVYIYRSEDGLSWTLTGVAVVDATPGVWPDDFDIAATKKDDGTTDVYVVWQAGDWKSQHIGKFAGGSTYSLVYTYAPCAPGLSIDDYPRIEANKTDWFLWTTAPPNWIATILKNGAVVLATNSVVQGGFYPWPGDIRYSNGKVVAVGTTGYETPVFALSSDGGNSWSQPGSPSGLGFTDGYSVDILGDKIIYSVSSIDGNWNSFYKIYEGTISVEGAITWTLVDSGATPFQYVNWPPGHIRFGQ